MSFLPPLRMGRRGNAATQSRQVEATRLEMEKKNRKSPPSDISNQTMYPLTPPQPCLFLRHLCEVLLALSVLPLRGFAARFFFCLCHRWACRRLLSLGCSAKSSAIWCPGLGLGASWLPPGRWPRRSPAGSSTAGST